MGVDNKTVGEKYMNLKKTTSTLTKVSKTNGKDTYELKLDNDDKVVDWDNTTETLTSRRQYSILPTFRRITLTCCTRPLLYSTRIARLFTAFLLPLTTPSSPIF